jgi:hypothetical protein
VGVGLDYGVSSVLRLPDLAGLPWPLVVRELVGSADYEHHD